MIQNFNDFLNEAKKPALYKVNDVVRVLGEKVSGKVNDYGKDDAFNSAGGMIVKIVEVSVKANKWFYKTELLYGAFTDYSRRGSRKSTFHTTSWFESELTETDVDKFMNIVKNVKYKKGDIVSINAGTPVVPFRESDGRIKFSSTVTTTVQGICVNPTIDTGKTHYLIQSQSTNDLISGSVEESHLDKPTELEPEAVKMVAKAIAEKVGLDMEFKDESWTKPTFIFKAKSLKVTSDGSHNDLFKHPTFMFFQDSDSRTKFLEGLNTLVSKYVTTDMKQLTKHSTNKPVVVNIKTDIFSTVNDNIEIPLTGIADTAKDLGIDIDEILHKNRGHLQGSKFGI